MKKLVVGMLSALVLTLAVAPHGVNAANYQDGYENNDKFADAYPIGQKPFAILASLWGDPTTSTKSGWDEDFYEVTSSSQNELEITLQVPKNSATVTYDYDLELYDANFNLVASSKNSGNKDEKIVRNLQGKKHYIRVYSYNDSYTTSKYILTGLERFLG
ncbi:hypothetical protein [Tumebacillus lipolyticus]|uniref:Uncharacterized protein n=1 Tax=Tumebacillus lipolyticus TaxID=1280370 RepID=A0ABW4ZR72_9BACL